MSLLCWLTYYLRGMMFNLKHLFACVALLSLLFMQPKMWLQSSNWKSVLYICTHCSLAYISTIYLTIWSVKSVKWNFWCCVGCVAFYRQKVQRIEQILSQHPVDLAELRQQAISCGGLLNANLRRRVWPLLLNVDPNNIPPKPGESVITTSLPNQVNQSSQLPYQTRWVSHHNFLP